MDLRPSEQDRIDADPKAMQKIAALAQYGTGGTLVKDGVIIGIFGYYELWPGVFEVWAFPSVHVNTNAMLYLRTVKRYIQAIEETFSPMRLQTTAFDDKLHTRWMEFLGFYNETPSGMHNYSVLGQTFNMWAKTYG